ISFFWEEVEDVSYYQLEYSMDSKFTGEKFSKSDILFNFCNLLENQRISPGEWFWRVKAIDAVGNQGLYSKVYSFEVYQEKDIEE
ncbi:MAG: hypothetical protein KAS39_07690, partial [Actinomycetia bacterium]|nr:hypothetical protein [Actinomycetes bacterium]